MKNKNSKQEVELQKKLDISAGSTPRAVAAYQRILHKANGNNRTNSRNAETILFDAQNYLSLDVPVPADFDIDPEKLFEPDEFVPARLPEDAESIQKLQQQGKLVLLDDDWLKQNPAALDNLGASADPRIGAVLANINEDRIKESLGKKIRLCLDYDRHLTLLDGQVNLEEHTGRLLVNLNATAPGGLSNGSVIILSRIARQEAAHHGLIAKRCLFLMLRGNLPVTDRKRAEINQVNMLKYIAAASTGQYIDPVSGQITEPPFELVFVQSNQNRHGQIKSLDQLVCHQAQCQKLLCEAGISKKIKERLVDIESSGVSDHKEPQIGFTISAGFLKFDVQKLINYCAHQSAHCLTSAITTDTKGHQTRDQALQLVRLHRITETQEDNALTGRMLNPEQLKGESLIHRLRTSFKSRTENTTGPERAHCLSETINSIYNNEFRDMYQSLMEDQAQKICSDTIQHLKKLIAQQLNTPDEKSPISSQQLDILSVLENYKKLNQTTLQVLMNKSSQLGQISESYNAAVNSAQQELTRFDSSSWWQKLFRRFLPRQISQSLEEFGLLFLETELQIMACHTAISHLLEPLIDFIGQKINALSLFKQKLTQVNSSCKTKAEKIAKTRSVLDVPLGFELTNSRYLNMFFEKVSNDNGGPKGLTNLLFKQFITEYGSISSLLDYSAEDIETAFVKTFKSFFEPQVGDKDVFLEFQGLYPDEHKQLQILRSLVHQTEGRVLAKGEANKPVIWLKFASVPNEQSRDQLQKLIQKADPKPETWHIIVDGSQEEICVIQIRGGICLSSLLNTQSASAITWQEAVKFAFDPVAALLSLPDPDDRQLRLVLAKAIVNGHLIYDNQKQFFIKLPGKDPVCLGNSREKAINTLRRDWQLIVRIESTFGRLLVNDEDALTTKLNQLTRIQNNTTNDPRAELINSTSVQDIKHQLRLLMPWAKRMRLKKDRYNGTS